MRENNNEMQLSCLVEYGTIYSKRDMIRILRDLDRVEYSDLIDGAIVAQGEGYVIEVYANGHDSTLIFNNRLHINVSGFDFLKMRSAPQKEVELYSGHRVIKLRPLTNVLNTGINNIEEEIDEQRIALASQLACDNEVDVNYFSD